MMSEEKEKKNPPEAHGPGAPLSDESAKGFYTAEIRIVGVPLYEVKLIDLSSNFAISKLVSLVYVPKAEHVPLPSGAFFLLKLLVLIPYSKKISSALLIFLSIFFICVF